MKYTYTKIDKGLRQGVRHGEAESLAFRSAPPPRRMAARRRQRWDRRSADMVAEVFPKLVSETFPELFPD